MRSTTWKSWLWLALSDLRSIRFSTIPLCMTDSLIWWVWQPICCHECDEMWIVRWATVTITTFTSLPTPLLGTQLQTGSCKMQLLIQLPKGVISVELHDNFLSLKQLQQVPSPDSAPLVSPAGIQRHSQESQHCSHQTKQAAGLHNGRRWHHKNKWSVQIRKAYCTSKLSKLSLINDTIHFMSLKYPIKQMQ